jgi:hypothetical protein
MTDDNLAADLLWGAGAIAEDVFGEDTKKNRRKVYHLHETGRLPTWRDGPTILSRRSLLRQRYAGPQVGTVKAASD